MSVGKHNFPKLREEADIVFIIQKYGGVQLKQDHSGSPHWKGKCPFHNEDTASFVVTPHKHIFKCFGCGKAGDVFDFLEGMKYSLEDALKIVKGETPSVINEVAKYDTEKRTDIWKQATPDRWPSTIHHERYGNPVAYWPYHNADGLIISYDCRFEYIGEDGKKKKDVLPLTFMSNGERTEWRWHAMSLKRSLSNLHLLLADNSRAVVIVEGKKTAAAAEQLITKPVVTTWQGGSNAIQQTDWSPLFGRDVIIWQDNDLPGYKASLEIQEILAPHGGRIKFVHNPVEKPKGWDLADALAEGWTPTNTRKFMLLYKDEPQVILKDAENETQENTQAQQAQQTDTAATPAAEVYEAEVLPLETGLPGFQIEDRAPGQSEMSVHVDAPLMQGDGEDGDKNRHFIFLGFEHKDGKATHCFYQLTKRILIKLSASSMGKAASLLELAPLDYWERMFPNASGSGNFNLAAAINFLIGISGQLPIFRGANIRGRGVWMDGKYIVVHNGDYLIVDGRHCQLGDLNSRYIYEQNTSFGLNSSNPLPAQEAYKFLDLCNQLKWERPVNGYLLAGWCVIAPVCGALKWRPHIWLTGGAGSGKTWVLDNILKPTLGDIALCVQGATSEAGIRQSLRQDARPVIFDEAEGESIKDADRMQSVLALMRAASSEDGGNIIKGTPTGGGAEAYQIRSCFAYASIGMQLSQQSDRSRVSILEMRSNGNTEAEKKISKEHFAVLEEKKFHLITPEYCQRLQARTISLLPTIIANAKTFAAAGAIVLGSQRAGDQLGALLAGAYSLRSSNAVSLQEALEWIKDKDWSEETALQETRDEHNLFSHIMEQSVRVEGEHTSWERTIGELVRLVSGLDPAPVSLTDEHGITKYAAMARLRRAGILIEDRWILISNTDYSVKKMLKDTSWSKNHANLLIRIQGAEKRENRRFGAGVQSRSIAIPLEYFGV